MDSDNNRRLRLELTLERNKSDRLVKKIVDLQGLTEEVSDTQYFLQHRERQIQALESRCNRYSGAIRSFLFNGRTKDLEDALQPHPEDEWRDEERRGRYRGQAEPG